MLINKPNVLGGPGAAKPFPMYRSHRVWIAIAVAATYLIVRRIASRLAMEFLPQ